MDIRRLTPSYAVSPQILPEDVAVLKAEGFTTIICNRPDPEIAPHLHASAIGALVDAAGMTFVVNPVIGGAITTQNVEAQGDAIREASGPVFATGLPR